MVNKMDANQIVYVVINTNCRGCVSTNYFTTTLGTLKHAQGLRSRKEEVSEDEWDNIVEGQLAHYYKAGTGNPDLAQLLYNIIVPDHFLCDATNRDFINELLTNQHFGIEDEECVFGVGFDKQQALLAFSEVNGVNDGWE